MIGAEKISKRVLYGMVGVIFIVFALFFFWNFDRPFTDNPDFNDPLLTDVLLFLMGAMTICTLVLAIVSMALSWKKRGKDDGTFNRIAVRRNAYLVGGGTFLLLLLTFLLGSSKPMQVNGEEYAQSLWLKAADMFIFSGVVMIFVAVTVLVLGALRYLKKNRT